MAEVGGRRGLRDHGVRSTRRLANSYTDGLERRSRIRDESLTERFTQPAASRPRIELLIEGRGDRGQSKRERRAVRHTRPGQGPRIESGPGQVVHRARLLNGPIDIQPVENMLSAHGPIVSSNPAPAVIEGRSPARGGEGPRPRVHHRPGW